jgi:hypothetical protein
MTQEKRVTRILAARTLRGQGYFDKLIMKQTPEDVGYDRVALKCGHISIRYHGLPEAKVGIDKVYCATCASDWVARPEESEESVVDAEFPEVEAKP